MTADLATLRELFPGTSQGAYLNTAAESLFMSSHVAALESYAKCKERGSDGREECARVEAQVRQRAALFIGTQAENIAFVASTSRGLDAVIKSIDWEPGDNIVLGDAEFPSATFAAANLGRSGVEHRVVPSRAGETPPSAFAELVDERTRLIVASLVSYKTGYKIDMSALTQLAHARGALVFVDAIQGMGVAPLSVGEVDFLCAGTYKWQLGAHGVAILYTNPKSLGFLAPPYVAYRSVTDIFPPDRFTSFSLWPGARRYEEGMPNYASLFVLDNALAFLGEVGVDRVAQHVAHLVGLVLSGWDDLGIEPLTTRQAANRAGIVSFETSLAEDVTAHLARRGVRVWGKDGRVRVSAHLYNTEDDVARLLDALRAVSESLGGLQGNIVTSS